MKLIKSGICGLLLAFAFMCTTHAGEPGSRATYLVLSGKHDQAPPFRSVCFQYGPVEGTGNAKGQWWEMELREKESDGATMVVVRGLSRGDPLSGAAMGMLRYQVKIPETGEMLEYRDVVSKRALLPGWGQFEANFFPHRAASSAQQGGFPETCTLLGQVLTLHHLSTNVAWEAWEAKILNLDPELLVGTSRAFKDSEGHRLPQEAKRQNYTYVDFTAEDYRVMIETGINLYTIKPEQEQWVRSEPVFYLRDAKGNPALRYPADLYRANYLGPVMFMDEPSILMVGDTNIHRTLKYFSDAAALIEKRTRGTYEGTGGYGSYSLERMLLTRGVNLGDMRLQQVDLPSWETLYDTTFYQMKGGGTGLVHEGRYQLAPFDKAVERFTGNPRQHTAEQVLQYHYAFLRGGTRPFGKQWGTAIYGQCDTNIAPFALTLAYDMGARYLWFWTSDHDHHVPWVEQMALVRHLREHVKTHARPSIFRDPPKVDLGIVIPNGYFLSLENLWWVRVMDKEGKNDASLKYKRLVKNALEAVESCFEKRQSFDITVDDGKPITGYRKLVRVQAD